MSVAAHLFISLNVTCPKCDEYIDLFSYNNGSLNEEGALINATCPDGPWSHEHEKFTEEIECPECGNKISIKGICW